MRLLVTATNPDATATAASTATVDDPQRAARQHRPADDHRHRPARVDADRHGRHLDRHRQQLRPTSGSARATARAGRHRRRDRARRTRSTVADVGATVRVLVTTTNPEGSASQASNATATVVGAGPVNTVAPAISGTAQRTAALTSTPGTWSGNGNTLRLPVAALADGTNWVDIAGATGAGYELAAADVGAKVRLLVTATNPDGSQQPRQRRDRDREGRAARQHGPADRHRRDAARHHAERLAGHLERAGDHLRLPVAARLRLRVHATSPARPARRTCSASPTWARALRIRVTATNADASVTATSIGSSVVQARAAGQHGRADDLRHRAAHRRR